MERIIIAGVIGAVLSICIWVLNMNFYRVYKGVSREEFIINKKKKLSLLLAVVASVFAAVLLRLYRFPYFEIVKEIMILNTTSFLGFIDFKDKVVPNKYLKKMLLAIGIILIFQWGWKVYTGQEFVSLIVSSLTGVIFTFGALIIGYILSRRGIGEGDIKLYTLISLLYGYRRGYAVLILSLLISAIYSLIKLMLKKIKLKDKMALVPYIAIASAVIIILGI